MIRNFIISVSVMLLGASGLMAQVELNRPLRFTSTQDSARIENLYTPNDSTAGMNVMAAQSGKFIYAITSGSADSILLSLPVNVTVPEQGMVIYFKAGSVNTGAVSVSFNGSVYYPLVKETNQPLTAGSFTAGQVVAAAFDGVNFQFLNFEETGCPPGFVAVTGEYCIEVNESVATAVFWSAITDCYSKNARLCNWGEWYYACVSMGASLSSMTNNWEYVDDPGNETDMVRVCGNGNCQAAGLQDIPVNLPKKYRCCYSRK